MIITTRFRVKQGSLRFYAIGSLHLVKKAAEATFLQLGWSAKLDKRGVLVHHPGGWLDRSNSAYTRATSLSWSDYYGTDIIAIEHHETNNPLVVLLQTRVYLKVLWFNKKKQEGRTPKFYDSLQNEFRKLEIPLIEQEQWPSLVASYPELRCSPIWGISARGINEPIPASEH